MQMSEACRKSIIQPSEGLRLKAYRDVVGILTIGYGHTSEAGYPVVRAGDVITEAQADAILTKDLHATEAGVMDMLKAAPFPVKQCEFDALVSLAFNIGLRNLRNSSLLRAYLSGDTRTAADKFLDWKYAGGRPVAGLTSRRIRERAWFLYGDAKPAPTPAVVASLPPQTARAVDHPDPWYLRLFHKAKETIS